MIPNEAQTFSFIKECCKTTLVFFKGVVRYNGWPYVDIDMKVSVLLMCATIIGYLNLIWGGMIKSI